MSRFKKRLLSLGIFIAVFILAGFFNLISPDKEKDDQALILKIGGYKFEIEIADDVLEQAHGLSGRASLAENQGMLFVFDDLAIRSFWMKDMRFPLDIIWIKGDQVVGFSENLSPASGVKAEIYYSPEPVDRVLEINAGLVKKLGMKISDSSSLTSPSRQAPMLGIGEG